MVEIECLHSKRFLWLELLHGGLPLFPLSVTRRLNRLIHRSHARTHTGWQTHTGRH